MISQLDEYFLSTRETFEIQTTLTGTSFQKHIWNSLKDVDYGNTMTYKTFSNHVYSDKHNRAVSSNIGRNPMPILYPCHRIVPKYKISGGFAGGLKLKCYLLDLEK